MEGKRGGDEWMEENPRKKRRMSNANGGDEREEDRKESKYITAVKMILL
jgi:hypothetical protein